MDHARAAISNLFGGEPASYTRFSIARQTDGDNSHVEMKLAADEDEGGEIGRPEHLHASMPPPRRNGKNLCFIIMAAVLLLLIGFLIGYLSYRGRMQRVNRCLEGSGNCEMTPTASYFSDDGTEEEEVPGPRILNWPDLRNMLSARLSTTRLETNLRQREGKDSFEAGKAEDVNTANYIHDQFISFRLDDVWNDEHYVRLQDKGSSKNQVFIMEDSQEDLVESPDAYVAYSKSGTVTGKPIYVNYGRKEDFQKIRNMRIPMNDSIIIFRAGKITLAEKVANARKEGAVGALMFPSPSNDKKADSYVPFGHAHLGTGDPFTPGFPSFNHTQFPPVESSGLPYIPVQTISREAAARLFGKMDGAKCLEEWESRIMGCKVAVSSNSKMTVKLTVNNVMVDRKILNIFGVIKGFEEPDRYVVLGAQRDSWGPGAAKAGVGTAILLELAHVISDMVKNDDYRPRRSIIFASWSAGEYGAVGATEWLEGYSTTLHTKAFTYINLDTAVLGSKHMKISASPLLYSLLETIMKRVKDPTKDSNLYRRAGTDWIKRVIPLDLDNAAFPFLAYSGIPVVSFGFYDEDDEYSSLGTTEDTLANLKERTSMLYPLMHTVAEVAGQVALRLTHDHELFLDLDGYTEELLSFQEKLWRFDSSVKALGLTLNWLYFARGDFQRAADALRRDIANSDRENRIVRRALNDRMMKVEYDFLSPYLSPKDIPFRHIFFGKGSHTLQSLLENLEQLGANRTSVDVKDLKEQLALATWTIKGAANALVGDIWNTDNEI
ncbi:transferrin receptor protein 1 isoform X1 [Hirundo rustica]|uniref:transferrin receptor protein 1 isoform X1 n=1 Tax=Hirundo rustica TaxID=43150 RepID=UPI001A95269C|nr:transferrin receptor protein 1 isoform X1 [Hirundo rustica]XP_039929653.1 transferrin receptor protein 1 isoform X1 [Hirundo rustica]